MLTECKQLFGRRLTKAGPLKQARDPVGCGATCLLYALCEMLTLLENKGIVPKCERLQGRCRKRTRRRELRGIRKIHRYHEGIGDVPKYEAVNASSIRT